MTESANGQTVLVTGASSYVASHIIYLLLEEGYNVRGTLRNMSREEHLRRVFADQVKENGQLEFVETDLTADDGWNEAAQGCDYVLHLATPVITIPPEDENELIRPAVDGTLRVLRAAAANGVRRTVMTSTTEAMTEGHDRYDRVFDEDDWSNIEGEMHPYSKSKVLAERAAWDFANDPERAGQMEISVICPGMALGPLLDGTHVASAVDIIRQVMTGAYPAWARISFSVVDVRDVATAHLMAMTDARPAGRRYICGGEFRWLVEIARTLNEQFADQGHKIPTRQMPNIVLRALALFDAQAKLVVPLLDAERRVSSDRIKNELGWQSRPAEESIRAVGASLIEHGLV